MCESMRTLLREDIVEGRDLFDLAAFAQKLSFRSISTLVGLPAAAEDFMRKHIESYAQRSGVEVMDPEPPELREFFQELFNAERAQPRGGLLTDLLAAEEAGTISLDERDSLVWGCWAAGSGSTAAGISLLIGLLVDAGLMAEAEAHLADKRWLEDVINEALRYGTPFALLPLISADDVVMESGVIIPEGERVQLVLSAANRDPVVFGKDASEFRPGRPAPVRHFAFGRGMHFCLGASLAGLEMRTALQEVVRHLPDLHLENWERKPAFLDLKG